MYVQEIINLCKTLKTFNEIYLKRNKQTKNVP